ncbi:Myb/SANT-like domain [Macleaya cordata]|uniref:Myb/SANT-like domain n=1 Tax=Macleaya cordata TaxID=56857 RepID=A0A200Q0G2_MACCD|nr:Myb/SANT-like domain [Macleaya cordata]
MGKNLKMEQIKNRYNLLRTRYKDVKKLMEISGFGWNPKEKVVQVDDEGVWELYLKYPDHKKYKTSGCPIYEELCIVFGDTTASGNQRYASAEDKVTKDVPTNHYVLDEERDDHETPIPNSRQGSTAFIEENEVESSVKKISDRGKRKFSHEQQQSKKETNSSGLSDALFAIADATKSKYVASNPEANPYSIPNCTKHLQFIEGVSIQSVMAALEKFQQPGWRQAFMSLDLDLQMEWLKSIAS